MGETFRKIGEWVKQHKVLAIALSGGILLLIYLYYSSQSAAQANAAQAASGQPSDAILSEEIQAQAAVQQEQISAQAQAAQYGYQAQVDLATIQAQQLQNNQQNQAALTLGLAQAGDSVSSILQLLGAQPGTVATTSTIGNTTTTPTATATVTGATATAAGTGTNAQTNPAPVASPPPATTPIQAAIQNSVYSPNYVTSYGTFSNYEAAVSGSPAVDPSTSHDAAIYEQDVMGTYVPTGAHYAVNNTYYSTPAATANLAQILGTQAVVSPSVVGASGGPFYNPPTNDIVTPSGTVDAGQLMSELQNTAPGNWSTILGGYGIQDSASVNSSIYQMFGANQAVPEVGVSGVS